MQPRLGKETSWSIPSTNTTPTTDLSSWSTWNILMFQTTALFISKMASPSTSGITRRENWMFISSSFLSDRSQTSLKTKPAKTCGSLSFRICACLCTLVLPLVNFLQKSLPDLPYPSSVSSLCWRACFQVWAWFLTWTSGLQWSVGRSFPFWFWQSELITCLSSRMQWKGRCNLQGSKIRLLMDWGKSGQTLLLQLFAKPWPFWSDHSPKCRPFKTFVSKRHSPSSSTTFSNWPHLLSYWSWMNKEKRTNVWTFFSA